jgi:hypothetical protein
MISIVSIGEGRFKVIDGMHRVTALQQLCLEKFTGIDYEQVYNTLCLYTHRGTSPHHLSLLS